MARCTYVGVAPVIGRRAPGRGAYLCDERCLQGAIRRGALPRAWRRTVDADALDALRIGLRAVMTEVQHLSAADDAVVDPTPRQEG